METEQWEFDFSFEIAPRFTKTGQRTAPIVYLDQWCWQQLVYERSAQRDARGGDLYRRFRELALEGAVVFPLSQSHYIENAHRANADARWDNAVVMAELSGFNAITLSGLSEWDAGIAVAGLFGAPPPVANPFGWGWRFCFSGREQSARIVDSRTGAEPASEELMSLHAIDRHELEREVRCRFELGVLALRDPRLEHLGLIAHEPFVDELGPQFLHDQKAFAEQLRSDGGDATRARDWLNVLSLRDSLPMLESACARIGVSPRLLYEKLAELEPSSEALSGFLSRMPIQSTFNDLRIQAHSKPAFRFAKSDRVDFLAAATALPFVDVLVTDRRTFNLLADAGRPHASQAAITHRLSDVLHLLEAASR